MRWPNRPVEINRRPWAHPCGHLFAAKLSYTTPTASVLTIISFFRIMKLSVVFLKKITSR